MPKATFIESGIHVYITKESDGLQNHSALLTMHKPDRMVNFRPRLFKRWIAPNEQLAPGKLTFPLQYGTTILQDLKKVPVRSFDIYIIYDDKLNK